MPDWCGRHEDLAEGVDCGGMQYIATILESSPLTLHFSLHNDDPEPVWIPRVLRPPGIMIQVEVRSESGRVVLENPSVRATWKLQPDADDSYQRLEPGYTFGTILRLDEFDAAPGRYEVRISYSNAPYRGTPSRKVAALRYSAMLPLVIP